MTYDETNGLGCDALMAHRHLYDAVTATIDHLHAVIAVRSVRAFLIGFDNSK